MTTTKKSRLINRHRNHFSPPPTTFSYQNFGISDDLSRSTSFQNGITNGSSIIKQIHCNNKNRTPEGNLARIKELELKAANRNFFTTAQRQINDIYSARSKNRSGRFLPDSKCNPIRTNVRYYPHEDKNCHIFFAGPNETVQSICERFNVDPQEFINVNSHQNTPIVYVGPLPHSATYQGPQDPSPNTYYLFGTVSPTGKLIEDMIYRLPETR